MTIAIFMYSMAGGGAERVVSFLLPYLKNKGIDVVLVLMIDTQAYPIPEDVPIYYLENSKGDEPGILKFLNPKRLMHQLKENLLRISSWIIISPFA